MWQYGLYNLSKEILGYHAKLNQLKKQDLESKNLIRQLEDGLVLKSELERLLEDVKKSNGVIQATVVASEESGKKISESLNKTIELEQKTAAVYTTTQQNESNSTILLATTKASNAEVTAAEKRIKDFLEQIDAYRAKITSTGDDATKTIENNKAETDKLITNLKNLEDQIKDQIQKATGYSLFHSFQTRQVDLVKSKKFWIYALTIMVAISLALTIYIMKSTTNVDVAFFMKLSMSLPLIFAITFCTVQYSRERKLEEEYAFKSNISISLIPYLELVDKLVDPKLQTEKDKYATFIIDSINKVFTSPADKIFEGENTKGILNDKNIKQIVKIIEPLIKIAK